MTSFRVSLIILNVYVYTVDLGQSSCRRRVCRPLKPQKWRARAMGTAWNLWKRLQKKCSWIFCIQTTFQNAQENDTWKSHTCLPQHIAVSLPIQEALLLCPGVAPYPRTRKCTNDARRYDLVEFIKCTELQRVISTPTTQASCVACSRCPAIVEQGGPPWARLPEERLFPLSYPATMR